MTFEEKTRTAFALEQAPADALRARKESPMQAPASVARRTPGDKGEL